MLRIGIDFGGTKIAYGLFDAQMRLVQRLRVATDAAATPDAVMDRMAEDVRALIRRAGHGPADVAGVGIGFPGHIDYGAGRVIIATNLPIWEEVPLRVLLAERLGLPVWLDNDTNTATLAEHRQGAGQGAPHIVYVTISTGIGCGFIIHDRVFRGTHGFAGELGQMYISDRYGYGNERMNDGVIESIASGPRLARLARERIEAGEESHILFHAGGNPAKIRTEHIGLALAEGDALAGEIIDFAAAYLGRMMVNLYELTDIGVIVYGGGVTKLGPRLMDAVEETFLRLSHGARKRPPVFVPAALGDDAGLIGAALLVEA